MTDLIDRADSGEVPTRVIFLHETADTVRMDVGESTRVIRPYEFDHPKLRPMTARHAAIAVPDTIGVIGEFGPQPTGPSTPPPMPPPEPDPQPSWNAFAAAEYATVRPRGYRPQRRAPRSGPWWFLTGVGSTLLVLAVAGLGALVVLR